MELPGKFLHEKCGTQEVREGEKRRKASSQHAPANSLTCSGKDGQDKKGPKDEDVNKSISSKKVKHGKSANSNGKLNAENASKQSVINGLDSKGISPENVPSGKNAQVEDLPTVKASHDASGRGVEKSHNYPPSLKKEGSKSHLQDLPPLPLKGKSSGKKQEDGKPPKPSTQVPSTSGVSGIPHVPRLDLTWLDSEDDQEDSTTTKTNQRTSKDSWSSSSSEDSDLDHSDWIVDMLMDGDSSDDEGEFVSIISTMKKEQTQATVESAQDVKTCPESKPEEQNKTKQKATEQTKTPDKPENSLEESGVKVLGHSAQESHNDSPKPPVVEDRDGERIDKVSDNKIGKPINVSSVQESEKEENAGNTDVDTKLTAARDIVNGVIEELLNCVVTESKKSLMNSAETSSAESAQTEVQKVSGETIGSLAQTNSTKKNAIEKSSPESSETEVQKVSRESIGSPTQADSTKKNAIEKSSPESTEAKVQKVSREIIGSPTQADSTKKNAIEKSSPESTEAKIQKVSRESIGSPTQADSTKKNAIEKSSPESTEAKVQKVSRESIGSPTQADSTKKNAIEKSSPESTEAKVQKVSRESIGSPTQADSTKKNAIEKSSPESTEAKVQKVSRESIGSPTQADSTKKNAIEKSSPERTEAKVQKVSRESIGSPTQADSTKNSTARSIVGGIIEDVLQVVVTRKKDSGEKDSEESSSAKKNGRLQATDKRTECSSEADSTKPSLVTKADKAKGNSDEDIQEKTGHFQPHPPSNGPPSTTADSLHVTRHSRARQRRRDRSIHPDDVSARTKVADDTNQSGGETKGLASAEPAQKRTRRLPTLSRERVRSTAGQSDVGTVRSRARARRRDSQSAHRQQEQRRTCAAKIDRNMADKEPDSEITSNSPPDTGVVSGEKRRKKPPDKKRPKKMRVKSAKQTSRTTERVQEKKRESGCEEQKVAGKPLSLKRPRTSGDKHQQRSEPQTKVEGVRQPINQDQFPSDISRKEAIAKRDDLKTRAKRGKKSFVDNSKVRSVGKGGKAHGKPEKIADTGVKVRHKSDGMGIITAEVTQLSGEDKHASEKDKITDAGKQDEVNDRIAQDINQPEEGKVNEPNTTGKKTSEKVNTVRPDDQENETTPVSDKGKSVKDEENGGHPPESEIADKDHIHSKTGDSDIKLSKRKKRSRKKKDDSSDKVSSSDSEVFDPDVYRPKFRASGKLDDPDEYKKLLEEYRELRDAYKLEPYKKGERPSYDLEFTFGEKEYLHYEPPPKTKKSKKGKPKATENRRQSRSDHGESSEGEGHQSRLSRLRSRLSSLARGFVSRVCSCATIKRLRPKVIH